jgi:hypothetical protein
LNRIVLAFRSFFAILFTGKLAADVARELGFSPAKPQPAASKPAPQLRPQDGALQILGILQRDSRLIDFLMEDISAYSDDQVGAAVRSLHDQSRDSLNRYLRLTPVIDGVEGSFTKIDSSDPSSVKLLGNVPANGKAPGGLLRHKGWRADNVNLPPIAPMSAAIIAPAEIEVE